jgi:hypothetical protein
VEQKRLQQRERGIPAPAVRVKVRDEEPAEEYDDVWPVRISSSARRYQGLADVRTEVGRAHPDVQPVANQRAYRTGSTEKSMVPPRRTATQTSIPVPGAKPRQAAQTDDIIQYRNSDRLSFSEREPDRPRVHWLVFVGLAIFTMLVGWVLLTSLVGWWQVKQDDMLYGRPRTYQTDQVVGHNDSAANPSHFIALNLNRHVEVVEFPGGDPSKAKIYVGPTLFGPGQNLASVTLTFKDVNADGHPDMIINVQDSHFVFINASGQFRPAKPGEITSLG